MVPFWMTRSNHAIDQAILKRKSIRKLNPPCPTKRTPCHEEMKATQRMTRSTSWIHCHALVSVGKGRCKNEALAVLHNKRKKMEVNSAIRTWDEGPNVSMKDNFLMTHNAVHASAVYPIASDPLISHPSRSQSKKGEQEEKAANKEI